MYSSLVISILSFLGYKIYQKKQINIQEKNAILDINKNGIDDTTETFKVTYFAEDKKIHEEVYKWGEQLKIKQVRIPENKIILNWFYDKKLTAAISDGTEIKNNISIYAKISDLKAVRTSNDQKPILSELTALEIENQLKNDNTKIEEERYKKYLEDINKVKTVNVERDGEIKSIKKIDKKIFNPEEEKIFLVHFYDQNNSFKFSLVCPYGQTIKIKESDDSLIKEYQVRQNTTITLNSSNYDVSLEKINTLVYVNIKETN